MFHCNVTHTIRHDSSDGRRALHSPFIASKMRRTRQPCNSKYIITGSPEMVMAVMVVMVVVMLRRGGLAPHFHDAAGVQVILGCYYSEGTIGHVLLHHLAALHDLSRRSKDILLHGLI